MIDWLIYNRKIDTYPRPTPKFIFMPTPGVRQRAEKNGKERKKTEKNIERKKGNYATDMRCGVRFGFGSGV